MDQAITVGDVLTVWGIAAAFVVVVVIAFILDRMQI